MNIYGLPGDVFVKFQQARYTALWQKFQAVPGLLFGHTLHSIKAQELIILSTFQSLPELLRDPTKAITMGEFLALSQSEAGQASHDIAKEYLPKTFRSHWAFGR